MKIIYRWIVILLCFYFFISCSEAGPIENNFNKYNGTWLWFQTVGGLFPRVFRPHDGETIKISYNMPDKFKIYRNDSLKVIASYLIEQTEHNRDKISYYNVITDDFYFSSEPDYAALRTDTLELWDGMIDGFFSFYKKLN
jgi:hypothetical protein